jgi:hypothetical protein
MGEIVKNILIGFKQRCYNINQTGGKKLKKTSALVEGVFFVISVTGCSEYGLGKDEDNDNSDDDYDDNDHHYPIF